MHLSRDSCFARSSQDSVGHFVGVASLEDRVLLQIGGNAVNFGVWGHVKLKALRCEKLRNQEHISERQLATHAVIAANLSDGCFVGGKTALEVSSRPGRFLIIPSKFTHFLKRAKVYKGLGHRVNDFAELTTLLP